MLKIKIIGSLFMIAISVSIQGQPTGSATAEFPIRDSFEIKSIDSDDFEDFKYIDSLIQDKRLVLLGESQHGVNDFNVLKFRIIRYLHQRHGFDVVAFEAGTAYCGLTNLVKDSLNGMEILVRSLTGVWRVKGNCELMNYIRDSNMAIAGIDPNTTSLGPTTSQYTRLVGSADLAKRFAKADSMKLFGYQMAKTAWKFNDTPFNKTKIDSLRNALKNEYGNLAKEIARSQNISQIQKIAVKKAIEATLIELSTSLDKKDENYFITGLQRDKLMAKNLEYLVDSLYKEKKIIVWAHNAHIAREPIPGYNDNTSTLVHVQPRIKTQALVVGLFTISGQYAWGNSKPETVIPAKGSLEKMFSGFSSKALWVSTINMDRKKVVQGIPGFKVVVPDVFDALILVKDTQASHLIPFRKEFTCE
jgi:erythromycin esterase